MSFGGSSTPTTQTTTQQLSPEQRELMQLAMPGVREFAATVPGRYQGSAVAGFDPAQTQGQNMALGAAGTQNNLAQSGAAASDFWLSPGATNPANNPGLQGAIDAATRPIMDTLTQKTLPAIRTGAIQTGNFGGSRQGIAEGSAASGAATAVGDTAAKVVNQAYDTNVNAQLKALGLLPQTQSTQTTGALTTSAVGDTRQALDQALLGEDVGNFNYDQLAPFLQSKEIMSLLGGLPGGSTTTEASTPKKNPWMGALGGAATGASLGSAFGPIGTAGGAGIGALLSFL